VFTTTEQHRGTVYGLARTAGGLVAHLTQTELTNWRELPISLHQIRPKSRDELRPGSGVLRCRESSMSDAYSLDRDEEGMRPSSGKFRAIFNEILSRAGQPSVISLQVQRLRHCGVAPGSRVAWRMAPGPDAVTPMPGIPRAGVV
jgi:prolyl-tRNA synthetase